MMTTPGYVATEEDLKKKPNGTDTKKLRTNLQKINPYMIKSIQPKLYDLNSDRTSKK